MFFLGNPTHQIFCNIAMGIYNAGCILCRSDDPVDIGTVFILQIKRLSQTAFYINRLVTDAHSIFKTLPVEIFRRMMSSLPQAFPALIKHFRFSIIDVRCCCGLKYFSNRYRGIDLISRVHEQHIISGRNRQTFIHGVINPLIRFRNELGKP
ncbi:hypothetical protein D3C86_1624710 [compost metagenome]